MLVRLNLQSTDVVLPYSTKILSSCPVEVPILAYAVYLYDRIKLHVIRVLCS